MSARDEVIAHMEAVKDSYGHVRCPIGDLINGVPTDALRRLVDERRMTDSTTYSKADQ